MGFRTGPSKNNKGHKLTPRMISFIDEFMVDGNGTKAVERSMYKTKGTRQANQLSAELMAHPLVKEEIQRRQDRKSAKVEVRAEYLIQKLLTIIEAEQENNPQAALRAIELAGKSIAFWKERQEISGPDGEAIKHEQHVKESASEFATRISRLAERSDSNVVPLKQSS